MTEHSLKDSAVLFTDVGFSYPGNIVALQNINLRIDKGEKIGIIGPNGSGKSTLLNLLNASYMGSGEISINGIRISKKTDREIKSMVGLVFQNPDDQLFCPTIYEDVAFGPANYGINETELNRRVIESLKEVGLEGFEDRSSNHLSFGEKKLASIAAIISIHPDIVAMDEPVSNLDHKHRRKIINWIKKSEHTIIVTSHDLEMLLEVCKRVIILNKGIKVADGTITEILGNKTLLETNNLEMPLSLKNETDLIAKLEI